MPDQADRLVGDRRPLAENRRPVRVGIELASLADAHIVAIRQIWAILDAERGRPLRLDRSIRICDDNGAVLLTVAFAEALAATGGIVACQ